MSTPGIRIPADHQVGVAECACVACAPKPNGVPCVCPKCGIEAVTENAVSYCAQCWLGGRGRVRMAVYR